MKKGIAIQTILLLLVGILVVGILVYLVYSYTSGSSGLSTTNCKAELTTICTMCSIQEKGAWTGTFTAGSDYISTINACNDLTEFDDFPNDPAGCAVIRTPCGLLGIK